MRFGCDHPWMKTKLIHLYENIRILQIPNNFHLYLALVINERCVMSHDVWFFIYFSLKSEFRWNLCVEIWWVGRFRFICRAHNTKLKAPIKLQKSILPSIRKSLFLFWTFVGLFIVLYNNFNRILNFQFRQYNFLLKRYSHLSMRNHFH